MFVVVIPEKTGKEVLRAPGTIKDRIKKLLAHKNSMKKKVKIKNSIIESAGTPGPKGNLQPFDSEESVSRDGDPDGGKRGNEKREEEGLEEEKREETALKNHVEQERSLRGDVFSEYRFCFVTHFVKNELWSLWDMKEEKTVSLIK